MNAPSKRRKRRGRRSLWSLLALALAVMIALPAAAFAADLQGTATLSGDASLPDEVKVGENPFEIKVWAVGMLAAGKPGTAEVVTEYRMGANGDIVANENQVAKFTFESDHHYTQRPDIQGGWQQPYKVPAKLIVDEGTPDGTLGTLVLKLRGSAGLEPDYPPDDEISYVKVVAPSRYVFSDILQPVNADGTSAYKFGAKGVIPVKFTAQYNGEAIATLQEAADHPMKIALFRIGTGVGNGEGVLETPAAGSANTDNLFRFDDGSDQYIYNLSIKGLEAGNYKVVISTAKAGGPGGEGVGYFVIK